MRHEAIEMVCAHVPQSQEPPPHCGGILGGLAHSVKLFTVVTKYHEKIVNLPTFFLA